MFLWTREIYSDTRKIYYKNFHHGKKYYLEYLLHVEHGARIKGEFSQSKN